MFIIFGWPERKSGEKALSTYCAGCEKDTVHKAFTQQSWFTLFFIPVFPLGGKHPHAICNICGQDVYNVTLRSGIPAPALADTRKCPMCAEFIKQDALVCKHCGHHLSAEEVENSRRLIFEAEERRAAAIEQDRQRAITDGREPASSGVSYTCPKCGYFGELKKEHRGSMIVCLFLTLFCFLPGLIYAMIFHGCQGVCHKCGFRVAKIMK